MKKSWLGLNIVKIIAVCGIATAVTFAVIYNFQNSSKNDETVKSSYEIPACGPLNGQAWPFYKGTNPPDNLWCMYGANITYHETDKAIFYYCQGEDKQKKIVQVSCAVSKEVPNKPPSY